MPITARTLALLRSTDTPTVCNALEHVMGGRTAEGFTKSPTICADPSLPPIVGFARCQDRLSRQRRSAAQMARRRLDVAMSPGWRDVASMSQ